MLLGSGTWLIVEYHGGWAFLAEPWLAGMVFLFAFEFIEGNTITRLYFMRLRRLTRQALAEGKITPELTRARGERLASFTHFLEVGIPFAPPDSADTVDGWRSESIRWRALTTQAPE